VVVIDRFVRDPGLEPTDPGIGWVGADRQIHSAFGAAEVEGHGLADDLRHRHTASRGAPQKLLVRRGGEAQIRGAVGRHRGITILHRETGVEGRWRMRATTHSPVGTR
jgi:hypothetical protein